MYCADYIPSVLICICTINKDYYYYYLQIETFFSILPYNNHYFNKEINKILSLFTNITSNFVYHN